MTDSSHPLRNSHVGDQLVLNIRQGNSFPCRVLSRQPLIQHGVFVSSFLLCSRSRNALLDDFVHFLDDNLALLAMK